MSGLLAVSLQVASVQMNNEYYSTLVGMEGGGEVVEVGGVRRPEVVGADEAALAVASAGSGAVALRDELGDDGAATHVVPICVGSLLLRLRLQTAVRW